MATWNNTKLALSALTLSLLLSAVGCGGGESGGGGGPSSTTPPPSGSIDRPVTGSATLDWQPPTERMDGSPLQNLSGYKILYGQQSRSYSYTIELTNPGLTRYFIDDLSEGRWYFAIVAVDDDGLESPPSAEASKTIG